MEYDGKMPYDYDYGWETIMRQGDDRKSLDQETVIGIEEEEEFAWVDSLELDGMQREMLDQMQKEDGIQTVLGYKLLWSSIFVTFRSKNSLCMSCFKWRLPTIIRMGTDMIIPYAHISPDCFIQTFRTGKTVRID